MSKPEFYDIIERGTFFMKIKECKNPADLSDHFISREKIKELCGKGFHPYSSKSYFNNDIIATIEEWILIIPPKALSTTLTTRSARTLLLEVDTDKLRSLCPTGYSIKGSRIYNVINCDNRIQEKNEIALEAARKQDQIELARPYERDQHVTHDDKWILQSAIRKAIDIKYGVSIGNHSGCSHKEFIYFCKRLCNWPDIKRVIHKQKKRREYVQDIKWIKKIWDNSELAMKN